MVLVFRGVGLVDRLYSFVDGVRITVRGFCDWRLWPIKLTGDEVFERAEVLVEVDYILQWEVFFGALER